MGSVLKSEGEYSVRPCEDCEHPVQQGRDNCHFTIRRCPECQRAFDIATGHLQRREARQRKRDKIRQSIERTIPPLFRKARICSLNKNLKKMLLEKPFNQGLLLWGPVGRGKTHTAAALARMYIAKGNTVKRISFKDLLLSLRNTFEGAGTEQGIFKPLLDAGVLILEDCAAGKQSEFTTDTLLHVLDNRLEHCKPTIITSNLSPENLEKAFGQRVGSRLHTFMIIRLAGEDKRKAKL